MLLPCYNEEQTIGDVVQGFRQALPTAQIYVYDNNSSDLTALKARSSGAVVVREPRQGKGNVVRRMFSDIDADIYVMADGDGTYSADDAPQLINTLLTERADMVVGTRSGVTRRRRQGRTCRRQQDVQHALSPTVRPRFHRYLFRIQGIHPAFRKKFSGNLGWFRNRDGNVGACLGAETSGIGNRTGLRQTAGRV